MRPPIFWGPLNSFFFDGDTKERAPKGRCQARGSGGMPPQKILRNLTLFWKLFVRFKPLKFLSFMPQANPIDAASKPYSNI